MPSKPGTYALVLENTGPVTLGVGRLGQVVLNRGWYAYVGSALGPGGLAARVGRHLRKKKSLHWHLDYLTVCLPVTKIWYTPWEEHLECVWAGYFQRMGGTLPVPGFGASDCRCPAHLFWFPECPGLDRFRTLCQNRYPVRELCPPPIIAP